MEILNFDGGHRRPACVQPVADAEEGMCAGRVAEVSKSWPCFENLMEEAIACVIRPPLSNIGRSGRGSQAAGHR